MGKKLLLVCLLLVLILPVIYADYSSLQNLEIFAGIPRALSPQFTSTVHDYFATVPADYSEVRITPTAQDSGATITVDGTGVQSGQSILVNLGNKGTDTVITIVVTGTDNSQQTYTITVTRLDGGCALLSNFYLISRGLSYTPPFGSMVFDYTATTVYSAVTLRVVPFAYDLTASITVNGQTVTSGNESQPITLNIGANQITIVVTNGDPQNQNTYNIVVTKPQPPPTILFTSDRNGNSDVFKMNPDGTSQINLTSNSTYDGEPSLAADNLKLAFVSDRDGYKEIYHMETSGGNLLRLTYNYCNSVDPAISSDGSKIAFASDVDGNYEIYRINYDGTGLAQLTVTNSVNRYPAWSPDGTKIAFISDNALYVLNADSSLTRLTNHSGIDSQPCWSPDGTKIAFSVTENGVTNVYTINSNGSGLTSLTGGTSFDGEPSWSPDGALIIFTSNRSGLKQLYTMSSADGSGVVNVSNSSANDMEPGWYIPAVAPSTPTPTVTPTPTAVPSPTPVLYFINIPNVSTTFRPSPGVIDRAYSPWTTTIPSNAINVTLNCECRYYGTGRDEKRIDIEYSDSNSYNVFQAREMVAPSTIVSFGLAPIPPYSPVRTGYQVRLRLFYWNETGDSLNNQLWVENARITYNLP